MQTHRAANRRKSSPSSRRTRRGRRELTKKKDIFTDRKCATPPTRFFRRYVQNIIRRYGIDRGLNFVLPRLGHQLSSEDSSDPVRVEWLQDVEWHRDFMDSGLYDVYDLHGVWNQTALRNLFFKSSKKSIMLLTAHSFQTVVGPPSQVFHHPPRPLRRLRERIRVLQGRFSHGTLDGGTHRKVSQNNI